MNWDQKLGTVAFVLEKGSKNSKGWWCVELDYKVMIYVEFKSV